MIKTKVVHRKLGKHGAIGLAYFDENLIEIDSRLKGKEKLEVYIHEKLHIMYPKWSEKTISAAGKNLAEFLWGLNFRQVDK